MKIGGAGKGSLCSASDWTFEQTALSHAVCSKVQSRAEHRDPLEICQNNTVLQVCFLLENY